jgi:hypothetical protein
MAKLSITLIGLLALSACATLSPAERASRERAKAIALAYLAKHRVQLPGDATIDVRVGTYQAEMEPLRHFYGVSVSIPYIPHKRSYLVDLDPEDPRREFIYTIWIDPRDWTVEYFGNIRRYIPAQ